MKLLPLLLTACIAAVSVSTLQAQRPGSTSSTSGPKTYELKANYHAGIAQSYLIEENTVAERTHSDSSKRTYNRNVLYYTTVRCIESREGISTVVITLDSVQYKFNAEGKEVTYDSQADITPKNFADLNNYIGPLNRPFNITSNSYGEVSKIEGEQVDFWRDYLKENKESLDSVVYMIWMQSLDNENLLFYGDLQKRVIPGKSIAVDSTWKHKMALRLDGVIYANTVTSKLDTYAGGLFVLTTNDTLKAAPQPIHVYGVPDISAVQEGNSVIKNTISLTNAGTINEVLCEARSWFKAKVSNEVYTQSVVTNISWKLIGQFQW